VRRLFEQGCVLLAEEALLLGFRGDPSAPQWLHSGEATRVEGKTPFDLLGIYVLVPAPVA
jgi:hypothetical protein